MDITYLGHSSFKLKGKVATVITDPFSASIGFEMPRVSGDIVTVSHDHDDHNAVNRVSGTARRENPYIISAPGEYEVLGVGVFGWQTFHDDQQGAERGNNTVYVIHIDSIRVAHLGDLGHALSDKQVQHIGQVDVALVPVGGFYTINPEQAVEVINALQPGYVIPMHYRTSEHNQQSFGQLADLPTFLKTYGADESLEPQEKLTIQSSDVLEETEIVVLKR